MSKITIKHIIQSAYWFGVGFILAGALLASAILFYFQQTFAKRAIPGIFVDNTYIGEKTAEEIQDIFTKKNLEIEKHSLTFSTNDLIATVSAKQLKIGYDTNLITEQALSLGKTKSLLTDVYIILESYINGTFLKSAYTYDENALDTALLSIHKEIYREPIDAQFKVENNRVVAFQESSNGTDFDRDSLHKRVRETVPTLIKPEAKNVAIEIPIKITEPTTTTSEANNFGIVEPIGEGHSTFYHSIPGRIHNVALAASRINGILVAPGEEFSFVKYLGDVSKYTGYKEAFIIQNGRTVLGDGGGVCQVSTTLFRAILNAGLPITERHPHAYRVGYYEQDSPPGFDATVYVPSVDLKFKNDTGKHILIQATTDTANLALSFTLYGTRDGREVVITKPIVSNVSSAPADLFQDDPTLPAGTIKQIDFAAPGGRSVFTRKVTRKGEVIIEDTFVSNYRPWQAVFLKGTKT